MPVSAKWRADLSENLKNLAFNLALYSKTSLKEAMQLSPSLAQQFFESKAFDDWKRAKDAEQKLQVGIAERLNEVIRACNVIAKTIERTR